jgi:hypothetical protein
LFRRICLVGALLAICSLALGVATAGAKGHHHKKPTPAPKPAPKPKPTTITSSCSLGLTVVPAVGDTAVLPDPQSGNMYGPLKCSGAGTGVSSFPFTVADSGDIVGNMTGYFATGSVTGAVDLTESSSALPTPYEFGNADLTGTFKVKSGTGTDKGVTGQSTTFTCSTTDSVHYSCTLKVKLTFPPAAA